MSSHKSTLCTIIILFLIALSIRITHILNTNPYPLHVDESAINNNAMRILQTGSLNPQFFNYPSLPIYINTLALKIGLATTNSQNQNVSLGFPYYHPRNVLLPGKFLLAILSGIIVIMSGFIAFFLFKNKFLLILTPLVLILSGQFLYFSWAYINVDMYGTFFITLALFWFAYFFHKDSLIHNIIIPAVFCGLAVGCKYNLAFISIPFFLYILIQSKDKIQKLLIFAGLFVLAFIAVVPFSVLDFHKFLLDIKFEFAHYKQGHPGFESTPGIVQFLYYLKTIINDFGLPLFFIGIFGIFQSIKKFPKKILLLLSFPVTFLLFMSMQRVHFVRNILSFFPIYSIFISLGIVELWKMLSAFNHKKYKPIFQILFITTIMCLLPYKNLVKIFDFTQDSRNKAANWIIKNVSPRDTIIIPSCLSMDISNLQNYQTHIVDFLQTNFDSTYNTIQDTSYVLVPLVRTLTNNTNKIKIDEKNSFFKTMPQLQSFGNYPIIIDDPYPTQNGNPIIKIILLKPEDK